MLVLVVFAIGSCLGFVAGVLVCTLAAAPTPAGFDDTECGVR